jgi:hypothetical protein
MESIKKLRVMNKLQKNLKKGVFMAVMILTTIGYAQSNVTNLLGTTQKIRTISANSTDNFNEVRNNLQSISGNYFTVVADFVSDDFDENGETIVFTASINSTVLYQIGVKERSSWFIRRPTGVANNIDVNTNLDYEIYDNLGFDGKFTFIFGHYYTAIAVDVPSYYNNKFKLAPVFFGMDSNIGSINNITSKFKGETPTAQPLSFYALKESEVYMKPAPADGNIASVISTLNANMNTIYNARSAESANKTVLVEDMVREESSLRVYPNPTNKSFNMDFTLQADGPVSFKIYNSNGQVVFKEKNKVFYKGRNSNLFLKEDVKLSSGIYMVNITSDEFSKSMKLIVE